MTSNGLITFLGLLLLSILLFLIVAAYRLPFQIFLRKLFFSALGATILGGIGLALGVLGPLVFDPNPEAPLLGIVLTGPLGFLIGMVLGWALSRHRPAKAK